MVKTSDTDPEVIAPRKRRSRAHRIGRAGVVVTVLVSLVGVAAVFLLVGQTLTLPGWVRDRVEARIGQNLDGLQVGFGDVELVVNKGWRPRVRLQDVVLRDSEDDKLLELSDAEASLAMRPLLRGQVQPKQIALSGAFATLRRAPDGSFSLSLGDQGATIGQAANLPELINAVDTALLSRSLSALRQVELSSLTLRYEDALSGRVWTVDGGQVQATRQGGMLRLGATLALLSGRDYASDLEFNYSSRLGETAAEFGFVVNDVAAEDIAVQAAALNWLEVLRAPISGALRGSVDPAGGLGPLNATLQIKEGVLQPTDQTRPIPFQSVRAYFTYDLAAQVIAFDEMSVVSDWVTGVSEGTAWLGGIEGGTLRELVGQTTVTNLSLNPNDLYDKPLRLPRATADLRLELNPFRLTLGEMTILDRSGLVRLSGSLEAAPDGWKLALDGSMDQLTPQRLIELWPEHAAPKPRQWVQKNLTEGQLSDIDFALRTSPGETPNIYLDFDYADATIRFLKTMPPIIGAVGEASLVNDRLVTSTVAGQIEAEEGGALNIAGSSFIIPDVSIPKSAPGILRLMAEGSVTAILSLLNRPPLAVLKDTDLPVDMAQGYARATGTLALPLKDRVMNDEIEFHVTGQVTDFESDVLIPKQQLSADLLDLVADQDVLSISGAGALQTLPVEARWEQKLGPDSARGSLVEGQAELSQLSLDTFGIGLPPQSVSGRGTADFSVQLRPNAPPLLALRSDLQGVGLRIAPLGWSKPQGSTGRLDIEGTLGERPDLTRVALRAAGLDTVGTVTTSADGGLDQAVMSTFRLRDWLNARVRLIGRGRNTAPNVELRGGTMDLRNADLGGQGASGDAGRLSVALNRLQITDAISLTDFVGDFDGRNGLSGRFSGKLNGVTPVTGQLEPLNGRSTIRVTSADAGGVFRDAGLLNQGRGGDFLMVLQPIGETDYNGTLRVTGTRVEDAPAIAASLNAASVIGLLDELLGTGIQFTEVDARFRISPDAVTLYESSAVGPSIGLSMDGVYDVRSQRLRMQGVISPVYLINAIGSLLTRKGEGLFGFTYTLTGAAASPSVAVNPLSALTPGMLREVFRAPAPVAGTSSGTAPAPERKPRRFHDLIEGSEGGR